MDTNTAERDLAHASVETSATRPSVNGMSSRLDRFGRSFAANTGESTFPDVDGRPRGDLRFRVDRGSRSRVMKEAESRHRRLDLDYKR
jgi:hypothetical protein